MHSELKKSVKKRAKRADRIRKGLERSSRPRLSVFRSSKHIYAQIIDDSKGATLLGLGTYSKDPKEAKNKIDVAKEVGKRLAELAKEKNITKVVFDRGPYKFHGRIAALAEGAREGGLSF